MDILPTPSIQTASPPPNVTPTPKPTSKFIFIVLGLIILFIGLFGGYYLTKSFSPEKPSVKQSVKIPQITSIQPSPTSSIQDLNAIKLIPSPISDPTSNWKTYTSKLYSFKYPSTWIYQARSEGCGPVWFTSENKQNWLTICGPYINQDDTPEMLAARRKDNTNLSSITLDKRSALKQKIENNNLSEVIIYVGGVSDLVTFAGQNGKSDTIERRSGSLVITFYIRDQSEKQRLLTIFDQILSTFRFD